MVSPGSKNILLSFIRCLLTDTLYNDSNQFPIRKRVVAKPTTQHNRNFPDYCIAPMNEIYYVLISVHFSVIPYTGQKLKSRQRPGSRLYIGIRKIPENKKYYSDLFPLFSKIQYIYQLLKSGNSKMPYKIFILTLSKSYMGISIK